MGLDANGFLGKLLYKAASDSTIPSITPLLKNRRMNSQVLSTVLDGGRNALMIASFWGNTNGVQDFLHARDSAGKLLMTHEMFGHADRKGMNALMTASYE